MKYLLFWAIFLVLFYIFLWWAVRRTPVTKDDEKEVRRISRLLELLNGKWNSRQV
ncbi:hypothetical protein [uncultured Alistipes sp.]|uniref:hypothetical protein n=1 Tax=uncultured Alistipes sp. TaxID=538949 RepID=UPI0025EABC32|nr:hypothetical protein [uncultured Alistipes sp.]